VGLGRKRPIADSKGFSSNLTQREKKPIFGGGGGGGRGWNLTQKGSRTSIKTTFWKGDSGVNHPKKRGAASGQKGGFVRSSQKRGDTCAF